MKSPIYYILAFALCSCAVQRATTSEIAGNAKLQEACELGKNI